MKQVQHAFFELVGSMKHYVVIMDGCIFSVLSYFLIPSITARTDSILQNIKSSLRHIFTESLKLIILELDLSLSIKICRNVNTRAELALGHFSPTGLNLGLV